MAGVESTDRPLAAAGAAGAEAPFIIWTLRRTGGTSLRQMLYWLSRHAAWQDEALNRERELGHITRGFDQDGDRARLDSAMAEVAAARKNLKHCIDTVPYHVTSALLRQTVAAGYGHVVLLRLDETDRQISLALARATKAWGPTEAEEIYAAIREGRTALEPLNLNHIRDQLERDAAALGRLMRLLMLHRVRHTMIFFEDLYAGPFRARVTALRGLAGTLGLGRAEEKPDNAFRGALMNRSQDTRSIFPFVPNLEEARAMVAGLTE